MGSKSAPDPPDYAAAAEATAESNMEMLQFQTDTNRPNQNTPFGSTTWESENDGRNWTQNTTLNPDSQRALSSQLRLMGDRSELGESMMGRARGEFGEEMNWDGLPAYGDSPNAGDARDNAEDALYNRSTSRLDPQWEQRMGDKKSEMVAQGLRPGDAAYDREMENLGRERTDAYGRATDSSIIGGGQEGQRQFGMDLQGSGYQNTLRQSQLAEQMQRRGFSLNEINALISGQQVGMPSMPSFNMGGRADGVNYSGAARDQYSGALDAYSAENARTQGLMSGAGSMAFGMGM